ncbi:MAG: oligosaccharide flippase family protein, partial [Sphingomonadales bacterium]|nr:oligosaccharide flippase family protein [Sphingomonadales bacterium]
EAILEISTPQALLQLRIVRPGHIDTAFTISLLRGAVLTLFLCLIAYPLAKFYGDHRLVSLICAMSLAPTLRGLRNPRLFILQKHFRFGADAASELAGKLAAFFVALALGLATRSYWAIAASTIVNPIAATACSYMLVPYRVRLSLAYGSLFYRFIGWAFANQTVSALNWQADRLILGKLVDQATFGLFTAAREFASLTYKVLFETMQKPIWSALAKANSDPARLQRAYSILIASSLTIGLPFVLGQALVAKELVRLMLGERWMSAVPVFQIISLTLIPGLYSAITANLFYATGRPDLLFKRNLQDLAVRIPLTVGLTLRFGMMGAVGALTAADIVLAVICMYSARRISGVAMSSQLILPWRGWVSVAAMSCVVLALRWIAPTGQGALGAVQFLLLAIPAGAATYGLSLLILWHLCGRPDGIEDVAVRIIERLLPRIHILGAKVRRS